MSMVRILNSSSVILDVNFKEYSWFRATSSTWTVPYNGFFCFTGEGPGNTNNCYISLDGVQKQCTKTMDYTESDRRDIYCIVTPLKKGQVVTRTSTMQLDWCIICCTIEE